MKEWAKPDADERAAERILALVSEKGASRRARRDGGPRKGMNGGLAWSI